MIKAIYTFFLALILATFVGLGISAFYTAPKAPDYPASLQPSVVEKSSLQTITQTPEQEATQKQYDADMKTFETKRQKYETNVSLIAMGFAILILVISLTLLHKIEMISDGLLLGGVFTLAYSMIRGLSTENDKFRFILVAIGLIITIALGYIKFIMPNKKTNIK